MLINKRIYDLIKLSSPLHDLSYYTVLNLKPSSTFESLITLIMAISVEAIVGLVGVFISIPPALLVIWKIRRSLDGKSKCQSPPFPICLTLKMTFTNIMYTGQGTDLEFHASASTTDPAHESPVWRHRSMS